ncbi:YdbH domain-containing protein [Isoalcanivorax indicus]|uniref:YdbH domain-containing protein n=1 Tax=Isoalcanivorax indicus TaxID=2202653 RepID=UPI0013C43ABA|nr:YdbH domain-containing protein [Isoalcanivorax indicus]
MSASRRFPVIALRALLLLLALMVLAALVVWRLWPAGLAVQGVSWSRAEGLQVAQLRWQQDACTLLRAESLRLRGWRPVTISVADVRVTPCPADDAAPLTPGLALPDLPALTLDIHALHVMTLPPLAVQMTQADGVWQLAARQGRSQMALVHDQHASGWQLRGQLYLPDWDEALLGRIDLEGAGELGEEHWSGDLAVTGHALGHAAQPQRASASARLTLAQTRWTLEAMLDAPLALGADWTLAAQQPLRAAGDLDSVDELTWQATASGPPGEVALALQAEPDDLLAGHGRMQLRGPSLAGEIPLRWSGGELTLAPAEVRYATTQVRWTSALTVPLAARGEARLPLTVEHEGVQITARDSVLQWQGAEWAWQGALALEGEQAGYRLRGHWRGGVTMQGLSGEPLQLSVQGDDLSLRASVPVTAMRAPAWSTRATFEGAWQQTPFSGTATASQASGDWRGEARLRSRLPFYDSGGEVDVRLPWRFAGDFVLDQGSEVRVAQGLVEAVLIRPLHLLASTPLRLDAEGVQGRLQARSEGLTAARWILPPVEGPITLAGQSASADLRIPAWQSSMALSVRRDDAGAQGTVRLSTPLSAPMSRGLPATLERGQVEAWADWRWHDLLRVDGEMTVARLTADFGGIRARGGDGRMRLRWHGDDLWLESVGPLKLAELDVGAPLRNIQAQVGTNLDDWRLTDIRAEAFGGDILAPRLHWPSQIYEPIVLTRIDLDRVAALQPDPAVQLSGRVGGYLPIMLGRDFVAVKEGRLANEEMLSMMIMPGSGVQAMAGANRAVQIALDALGTMLISTFQARLSMSADGWLDAAVTIHGNNPQQRLPVIFNYTHQENILALLRSLRIGDDIQRQFMQQQRSN